MSAPRLRISPSGPLSSSGPGTTPDLDAVLSAGNDGGAQRIENIADPVDPQDAATKAYVDAIAPAVPDLDAVLGAGNDGGAQRIENIADPVDPQDAATKAYVDGIPFITTLAVNANKVLAAADWGSYTPGQVVLLLLVDTSGGAVQISFPATLPVGTTVVVARTAGTNNVNFIGTGGATVQRNTSGFADASSINGIDGGFSSRFHPQLTYDGIGWGTDGILGASAFIDPQTVNITDNQILRGQFGRGASLTIAASSTPSRLAGADLASVANTKLLSEPYTVAGPPASPAQGDFAYFSNGDFGVPGFAHYNGTSWICERSGLPVRTTAYAVNADAPTTDVPPGASALFTAGRVGALPTMGFWSGTNWYSDLTFTTLII